MAVTAEHYFDEGRRAHEAGDLERAISVYQAALSAWPDDPKILFLLGNIYLEAGQAGAATECLARAAARQRNHPAILGSLGEAYFAGGRAADAETSFRKAMRLDPAMPQWQMGLANALAVQKKFAEAETLFKRVASRQPDNAWVWLNLGNLARDRLHLEEAVAHYRAALRLDGQLIDARNNLGSALHSLLRFAEAEQEYRACIALDPHYLTARTNLTSVLIDVGRFREAEAQCRELVALAPEFANTHAMLASAVSAQGRISEALPHFRQAVALAPAMHRYASSYASALCEAGQVEAGLRAFGRLLPDDDSSDDNGSDEPDAVVAKQLAIPALLAHGYFTEGWRRHRLRPAFLRIGRQYERLNLRQQLPDELAGKHVCVVCEQGLGDELFFLRFVPRLKALGPRVTYCASPKLGAMLARVAALDAIVSSADAIPASDLNILVGDLPHALDALDKQLPAPVQDAPAGTLLGDYPWQRPPYAALPPPSLTIAPLPHCLDAMRARLAAAGPPPYLGVTWRGGTAPENQRGVEWKLHKEIPMPLLAASLREWPGTLLALQRMPGAGELAGFAAALSRSVADFTALNEDLEHMLALLALIDDYVGVSNTNMHLRAAVGRQARVLVPAPAEWRWMGAGASPWFPGFGVYRQALDATWDGALAALRADLQNP